MTRKKTSEKKQPEGGAEFGPPLAERIHAGKALRKKTPRTSQSDWSPAAGRDPIEVLKASDRGRIQELLPIRYGRMRKSPFAFYRGAAALMAMDLAETQATGLRVQACGDCHVANFGGFGSPERELLFDINDFDETLPAPWEWDVKRLAASLVVATRVENFREGFCRDAAREMVESYRLRMRRYASMRAIDVWYSHLTASVLVKNARTEASKRRWQTAEEKARRQTARRLLAKLTVITPRGRRIADRPPLVYHTAQNAKRLAEIRGLFRRYQQTLPPERRIIFDRYHVVDVARKVVGVGSVGTRCAAMLLMAEENDPLFLQFKEARESVLEPYAGKSKCANHGERVVTGQRMLQAASDMFLGWTEDDHGKQYYFRQLRDMKMSVDLNNLSKDDWIEYAGICGWTLARAHARTGDPAKIAGYLGKSETFDRAIVKFAVKYADQTERDHARLLKAIRSGKIRAESENAN
jgi:uncharacterized protein (DUF2252 family)